MSSADDRRLQHEIENRRAMEAAMREEAHRRRDALLREAADREQRVREGIERELRSRR